MPALRTKPLPILSRVDERLDHLSIDVVPAETGQLVEPEVKALIVQCRLRRIGRVPSQITEVLHQHERAIEFLLRQDRAVGRPPQSACSGRTISPAGRY